MYNLLKQTLSLTKCHLTRSFFWFLQSRRSYPNFFYIICWPQQLIFVWFPWIFKLETRSLSQSQTPARIPGEIPACLAWCLEPGPRPLPRTADWLRHSAVPTVSEDNTSVRLQGTQVEVTGAGWLPPPPHLYPVSQVVPELPSKMQCCIRHSNLWDFVQVVFRK